MIQFYAISIKISLVLLTSLSLWLAWTPVAAYAQGPIVDTALDENDGDCGDGDCSLRDAIQTATAGQTITFDSDYAIYLNSTLNITQSLTIDGSGHEIIVSGDTNNDGSGNVRIFEIVPSKAHVTLRHLNMVDGRETSSDGGGAIRNNGHLTVTHSTLQNNFSKRNGGAIIHRRNTLVINNSTFINNRSNTRSGGAILNGYSSTGKLYINNSTFTGNSAHSQGSAIYSSGDLGNRVYINNSTFFGNGKQTIYRQSGQLHLKNTIMAGNTGTDCNHRSSLINTLIDDGSCNPTSSADPLLAPLDNYGGSTETFALLPGSPAINTGDNVTCESADQRGLSRLNTCDMGAFESQGFALALANGDAQTTYLNTSFAQPLAITVTANLISEPVGPDGVITLIAPISGASLISPTVTLTTTTAGFASSAVMANGVTGSYTVTAQTVGGGNTIAFRLSQVMKTFEIIHTNPISNKLNLSHNTHISATFDADVDTTSLSTQSFTIRGLQSGIYTGSYTFPASNTVRFDHLAPFHAGEVVVVDASSQVKNIEGTNLTPHTWQFTAEAMGGDGDGSSWQKQTISSNFNGAWSVTAADVDSDGDLDILGTAFIADDVVWWKNDGNQNFSEHIIAANFDGAFSVAVADIDGDGDLDILGAAYLGNDIAWWENDGNENFTEHTIADNFGGAYTVYAADVDGDGDIDILGAAYTDDKITWWENDGNQNFTEHTIAANIEGAFSVTVADVDGDGDPDVLGAAYDADDIAWWENDGNQNFTEHTIATNFDGSASVYAADMDADGDLDVLGAAYEADAITWWENDGNQNFTEHTIATNFDGARGIYAADVDGDGDLDVLGTAGDANEVNWWKNESGDGSIWREYTLDDGFVSARGIYAADVDSDGDVDILGTAVDGDDLVWWKNSTADLQISKSASTGQIQPGQTLTYSLAFSNTGDGAATGIVITDTLPDEITVQDVISSGDVTIVHTISNQTFEVFEIAKLLAGQSGLITITAQISNTLNTGLIFTNTAIITTSSLESDLSNNNALVGVQVACLNAIIVQNNNDSGVGSLRQAIMNVCEEGTITFANSDTITLNSTLNLNKAMTIDGRGQAVTIDGNNSVRIFNIEAGNEVALSHLAIVNGRHNSSAGGGGIANAGTLRLEFSTIADNRTNSEGGGLTSSGLAYLYGNTFSGNVSGGSGAAVRNNHGTMIISNTTFTANKTNWSGAAVLNRSGLVTITHATVISNITDQEGNGSGSATITGFGGGTTILRHSLVAGNIVSDTLDHNQADCSNITDGGYNLVGEGTGCPTDSGTTLTVDPATVLSNVVAPLGYYGGETDTFALLPGSFALDAIPNGSCLLHEDQRAISRLQDFGCDIGAFESQGFNLFLTGGNYQQTEINTLFSQPLSLVVIANAFYEPVGPGGIIGFAGPISGASLNPTFVTATTDMYGAVSAPVTANSELGDYQVLATASGVGNLGIFQLSNSTHYTLTTTIQGEGSGNISLNPAGGVYLNGTVITLTATADVGSTFDGWSGDINSQDNPLVLTLNSDLTINANFAPVTYTLNVHVTGDGTGTVHALDDDGGSAIFDPSSTVFDYGTVVTLTAIPENNAYFAGWTGDLNGAENPETLTMTSDKVVTATFSVMPPTTYTLQVNILGQGSVVPLNGTYVVDSVVTLEAMPDTDWQFAHWSGDLDSTANPANLTMDGHKVVTATFSEMISETPEISYTLSLNIVGNGTISPTGGTYISGTVISLMATADNDWQFEGWSGDLSGTENPVNLLINGHKVITATFSENNTAPINYTLDLTILGGGTVTQDPEQSTYDAGRVITLTATADISSAFVGWSGAVSSTINPLVLTMDSSKVLTATFEAIVESDDQLFLPVVVR
ncbi:MAG: FG-GAP-like repeat-containing protein [Chloroflexota bacterium]